jgi:hypothetical protein
MHGLGQLVVDEQSQQIANTPRLCSCRRKLSIMSTTQTLTTESQAPLNLTLAYDNQAHEEVMHVHSFKNLRLTCLVQIYRLPSRLR